MEELEYIPGHIEYGTTGYGVAGVRISLQLLLMRHVYIISR